MVQWLGVCCTFPACVDLWIFYFKASGQYFPLVLIILFFILRKVGLIFESVKETPKCDYLLK